MKNGKTDSENKPEKPKSKRKMIIKKKRRMMRNKILAAGCVFLFIFFYLYFCYYCMIGGDIAVIRNPVDGQKIAAPLGAWVIVSMVLIVIFFNLIERAKDSNKVMAAIFGDIILTWISIPVVDWINGDSWLASLLALVIVTILLLVISPIILIVTKRKRGEDTYPLFASMMSEETFRKIEKKIFRKQEK